MLNTKEEEIFINNDESIIVELSANTRWVDNGIGSYEYWGYKGNDVQMEVEVDGDINYNKKLYSEETQKIIDKYIEDNSRQLNQWFVENHEDEEVEDPSDRYEREDN